MRCPRSTACRRWRAARTSRSWRSRSTAASSSRSRTFYAEVGIRHLAIYRDPKAAAGRALGALGLPTTVVIDQGGREVGRLLGPAEWDSAEALALLRSLMEPEAARLMHD